MSAKDLKSEDLYRKVVPSVVTLNVTRQDGSQSLGSAFLTLKDGLAVTAWHVVKDASYIIARFSSGEEFEISGLVDKDEKRDLAVVRVKVFGKPILVVNSDEPAIGSKLYVIGAPRGLEFSISDGLLSQIQLLEGTKQFQFSCPVSPGNSGGPLLNSKGEVIGVVSWQLREGQNLNFAVPAIYAKGLDISLPTKPWADVRSASVAATKEVSSTEVERLLSDMFVLSIDISTAVQYTTSEIVAKSSGFRKGVPSFVYTLQRELEAKQRALSSAVIRDSAANVLVTKVKASSVYILESIQLLIDAIKTAQSQGGWGSSANDMLARSHAASELVEDITPEEVSGFPSIVTALPTEAKLMLGLETDSTHFRLGVFNWIRNPLVLVLVPEKSFAYDLGFRTDDLIVSVNGVEPVSIKEVKRIMLANLGKDIPVVVIRDGEREEFEIEVPEKLPPE